MKESTFLLCELLREIEAWGQDYFNQMVTEELAVWWVHHTCYHCQRTVPA